MDRQKYLLEDPGVIVKSPAEIAKMRKAGRVVAGTIAALVAAVQPGMKTADLDDIAHREIIRLGGKPSFKGYRGYPAYICVSLNDEVVHGIPGLKVVDEGDLVKLDVGAIVDGFHGDAAVTVGAGKISPVAQKLIDATRGALEAGIAAAKRGARLGDVSWAVQNYAESRGFSVVREYVGHGIGRALHEEPAVPNYGASGRGLLLTRGMVLAIEPMVNVGGWKTTTVEGQWVVTTEDGSLSAHFEHTIAITDGEPEVLTRL